MKLVAFTSGNVLEHPARQLSSAFSKRYTLTAKRYPLTAQRCSPVPPYPPHSRFSLARLLCFAHTGKRKALFRSSADRAFRPFAQPAPNVLAVAGESNPAQAGVFALWEDRRAPCLWHICQRRL